MGMNQLLQALSALPQIMESVKKMTEEDKMKFIGQLGLEGQEQELAYQAINCFQEGRALTPEQQRASQGLLEKAMRMNGLDMTALFGITGKNS